MVQQSNNCSPLYSQKIHSKVSNILHGNQNHVHDLISFLALLSSASCIIHLNRSLNPSTLLEQAQEALSQGLTIVVPNFKVTKECEFTETGHMQHFGCFPDQQLNVHGVSHTLVPIQPAHILHQIGKTSQGPQRTTHDDEDG